MAEVHSDSNKRGTTITLLILFILSLGGNAFLFNEWYHDNYQDGQSLSDLNKELLSLLDSTQYSRDSLQNELNMLSTQYQALYDEAENFKFERQEALEELGRKKVRIRQLLNQTGASPMALAQARNEINSLKKDIEEYKVRLEVVLDENSKYQKDLDQQKEVTDELAKDNQALASRKDVLEKRLESATFKISDLTVLPQRYKRNKWEATEKYKKVERIKVRFTILESPMMEPGDKVLTLRMIGTAQEVLGADVDQLTDSDELYSMKKDFTYTGEESEFNFIYEQEAAFKEGTHYAELWCDGELITRTAFNLQ